MKKVFFTILVCGLIGSMLFGNVCAAEDQKLKTQIVRIEGDAGVEPLNLLITPGTVVIWLNQYKSSAVEVLFPDKKVTMACQSPVNFIINKDGTYVSNSIPFGGVASLCFIEKGTFKYEIYRATPYIQENQPSNVNPFRFEGKIVVR